LSPQRLRGSSPWKGERGLKAVAGGGDRRLRMVRRQGFPSCASPTLFKGVGQGEDCIITSQPLCNSSSSREACSGSSGRWRPWSGPVREPVARSLAFAFFVQRHPFPLMAILTVPKVLREKLGDEGVEALIALLNEAAHHERDNLLGILAERFERRVTEEVSRLEVQMAEVEKRLDHRIAEEVSRLEVQMAELEKRLDHRITEEVARLEKQMAELEKRLDHRITEEGKRLEVQMAELEKRLDHRITEEVSRLEKQMAEVSAQLQVTLSERYASLVRWMFIFWAGQIGVIAALLALLR